METFTWEIEELVELQRIWETLLKEDKGGWLEVEVFTTNLYNPFNFSPKPIIFWVLKSWIVQLLVENCTKQERESHSFETEMRFKVKAGEYRTLMRYKLEEKEMLPVWWTNTYVSLGRLTLIGFIL